MPSSRSKIPPFVPNLRLQSFWVKNSYDGGPVEDAMGKVVMAGLVAAALHLYLRSRHRTMASSTKFNLVLSLLPLSTSQSFVIISLQFLKKLKLKLRHFQDSHELQINAPLLEFLCMNDDSPNKYSIVNLSNLFRANLKVHKHLDF
ncbi:putative F-box/RNI/FBD-like domain-containing protein [Sesbania bispinosa]|nr:putative F-box/RNI/FBD-like domain-containing protein [Sesbania bispinosa]